MIMCKEGTHGSNFNEENKVKNRCTWTYKLYCIPKFRAKYLPTSSQKQRNKVVCLNILSLLPFVGNLFIIYVISMYIQGPKILPM